MCEASWLDIQKLVLDSAGSREPLQWPVFREGRAGGSLRLSGKGEMFLEARGLNGWGGAVKVQRGEDWRTGWPMRRVQQGRTADRAGHGANPQACSVSFSCVCLPGGEAADFRGSAESPGSNLTHSHTKVCHGQNWTLSWGTLGPTFKIDLSPSIRSALCLLLSWVANVPDSLFFLIKESLFYSLSRMSRVQGKSQDSPINPTSSNNMKDRLRGLPCWSCG